MRPHLAPALLLAGCATASSPPPAIRALSALEPSRAARAMLAQNGTPQQIGGGPSGVVRRRCTYRNPVVDALRADAPNATRWDIESVAWALECDDIAGARATLEDRIRRGDLTHGDLAELLALRAFVLALSDEPSSCVEQAADAMTLGATTQLPADMPSAVRDCWTAASARPYAEATPELSEPRISVTDSAVYLSITVVDRRPMASDVRVYFRPAHSELRFSRIDLSLVGRPTTTLFAPVFEVNVALPRLRADEIEYYVELVDKTGSTIDELGTQRATRLIKLD